MMWDLHAVLAQSKSEVHISRRERQSRSLLSAVRFTSITRLSRMRPDADSR